MFVLSVFTSLLLLVFAAPPAAAVSPSSSLVTDVASLRENVEVIEGIEWCRTSTDASREFVASGGCKLRTLARGDRNLGYIKDAVWMRLRLRNSSPDDAEPWLQIGHPRLTEVTVFQRDADGRWRSDRTGYGVPRSERNRVGRYYDVTPLRVAAGETSDIWIRVESRSRVNLETRLWNSDAYRGFRLATSVWMGTAMGSLLFGLTLSLMMLVSFGHKQYGDFAISLVGQFVHAVISSGVFLRFLWPATMPVPIELMSVSAMLMVVGIVGYSYSSMPTIRNFPEEHLALRIVLAAVLMFQLVSIFVDYSLGSTLWTTLLVPLFMLLSWVSFRVWRQGELFARWIFIAFVALTCAVAVRTPIARVNAPEFMIDIVLAPIAMLIVVALTLMAMIEKSRNLNRRLMEAELANHAQVDFLSRMSHELRTPLDSVLGNAQLLMRSSVRLRAAPELSGIVNSGRQLLRLIDEILDYAKGSAGALTLRVEPVRLADFLHQVETSSRILATRARNTFIVQARSGSLPIDDVVVRIDAGRLRQVLDNLIVNAVRHTRDGTITVEYDLRSKNDESLELGFAVIDTGEGIALEDRERIFRPFERLGRADRYGGKGAGMGLAIVRQLVGLMGGDVGVESTPGLGSIFRFSIVATSARLKTTAIAEAEPRPIEARGYAGRPRIAFVIDDDPGGRAIFAGLLARTGFIVHEAENGNDAIRVFSTLDVLDLVVTDQFMPDGDGWTVLESIHRHRPDTPVVMISAAPASQPEGWVDGIQFSAEFLKPVNHNDFLVCVGRLLGLRWTYWSHEERGIGAPPVARPNGSELASLRDMVELGEVTALREWAQALRRRAPEYSSFADRVETSAADLDFDALEALMTESRV